jgi:hypothetical protein
MKLSDQKNEAAALAIFLTFCSDEYKPPVFNDWPPISASKAVSSTYINLGPNISWDEKESKKSLPPS